MITADLVFLRPIAGGVRGTIHPTGAPMTRAEGEALFERWPADRQRYQLEGVAACQCCGRLATIEWANGQARCDRHVGRNPCAIEGCTRSRAAPESGRLADDSWLCSAHWRRYCPPRSRRRRAYHAFWRKEKRLGGWTPELAAQFRRFWDQLIKTARAKAEGGSIDKAAIDRLFGWGDEGPA